MTSFKRTLIGLAFLLIIILLGTLGFVLIEGWAFFEGLYMTVITLTTVGFGEVSPLSKPGRVFTIMLIFLGMGFLVYVTGSLAQVIVEGQLREFLGRRRLEKEIQKLKNHFIICGFGRFGQVIVGELRKAGVPLVVIDNRPEIITKLDRAGYLYIAGNATDEEVLQTAGLNRARGLVAAVYSDADNVYIVLTARTLNPQLLIAARAREESSELKLFRAGADKVVAPHAIGGHRLAQTILRPTVVDFIEIAMKGGVNLTLEEIPVGGTSEIIGLPLRDSGIRQKLDLIIVAIKRADGQMLFNPRPDTPILLGDTLIAIGPRNNLDRLTEILKP
ncbi:MAG: potassium channel protein [Deltaproteobacteria bacterium]|nr:potassium channel protein [Deltaproteobacteria bacterium]MBW1952859.1 potassium channel protein [Deltaproteobacteria bacterium]MBW1985857.1 potassium channel protein [Deltaproteobacteria bacterium]MBW2133617.1 potassium channel protein [Deltaproteobacteria bacterium]